ncbi:MAG: hypothetical protein KDC71_22120 [Acidobacteria bacterium]|nr:hypothetical protein [Acidobacteriota bacterium]
MNRPGEPKPAQTEVRSAAQIDRLSESHQHASIFGSDLDRGQVMDFNRLEAWLLHEANIPSGIAKRALATIGGKLAVLGLEQPSPALILQWTIELLAQMGYSLEEPSRQALSLSLQTVEWSIYHPTGALSGANQNPEATAQKLASHIKTQYASKRVFQKDVWEAHEKGDLEIMHVGEIDRPDAIFLTPDYVKLYGLPANGRAPGAGPAKRAQVLLSHLIRFTHELRCHIAGTIHWGFFNTLLLPFVEELSDKELNQFTQQLFFEFAQLEATRGVAGSRVHLDFDFDLPPYLAATQAIGPNGQATNRTYGDYENTLTRFNEVVLDVMERGDFRGCPFLNPHICFHFNQETQNWSPRHQKLVELAARWGQPALSFSHATRDCGPLGRCSVRQADWLRTLRNPSQLRGFSTCTIALNLPRLFWQSQDMGWEMALEQQLSLVASAIRQKRMFLSRLMAYGPRGPLRFLRHRHANQAFLKMENAMQTLQWVGLGELADLANRSLGATASGRLEKGLGILDRLNKSVHLLGLTHKWKIHAADIGDETVGYRMAALDLKSHGGTHAPLLLPHSGQTEPCYASLSQLLADQELDWKERFRLEAKLHAQPLAHLETVLFAEKPQLAEPLLAQRLVSGAVQSGIRQLRIVPDMKSCMDCFWLFHDVGNQPSCPQCNSSLTVDFGWNQSQFSPIPTWCRGKRSEWQYRHRYDRRNETEEQKSFGW